MLVIHFFDLEDFARELRMGVEVRLETTIRSVPYQETSGLVDRVYELHARAYADAAVRAWCVRLGAAQYLHGRPFGTGSKVEDREALADAAKAVVSEWLREAGMKVLPGLIDLGGAKPVSGHWSGLKDLLEGGDADT